MKVLLISHGLPTATTSLLFAALAEKIGERHEAVFKLRRSPPKGIPSRLWRLVPDVGSLIAASRSDVIILHTSALLSYAVIALGRLQRKKIIVFFWDTYPDSFRYSAATLPPILEKMYSWGEKLCLRTADCVLLPNTDYTSSSAAARLANIGYFPLWPAGGKTIAPKAGWELQSERPVKIAFAGQINKIRGLPDGIENAMRAFSGPVELHVFSSDRLRPSANRAPRIV